MFVYSLKRWAALARYLNDGDLPIDNNWVENQVRPIAIGIGMVGMRAMESMRIEKSYRTCGAATWVWNTRPTRPAWTASCA